MKQTTRLLALSALVLAVMLGVFGAPALEAPSVAFAQGQVPAAPTGLTATRSGASTINLSWTGVSGAVRYQVYSWDSVDGWQRLDGGEDNPHTTTTFSHTGLTADRLYYYQVYGVNAQGDRGPRSNRANEVAGQNAPGRPSLTATPGYLVNVISWPAVSGATSYILYAWDQSWSQVGGTITGTSYTHTGLTAGQTYYYEARAVNASSVMGAYSAQVSATVLSTPTVTAPQSLRATGDGASPLLRPEDQQVTLTWQTPPGAGASITGYQYRYAASTATLPDTWTNAGMVMTQVITGLTNGTQYTFEVRAMSSTGEGPASRVMATPADEPDAPVLEAAEGYRLVTLSWETPDNNGAAITAYHIEMLNAQSQWVAVPSSVAGTATSYTVRGLNDSTVYTYRIIAENAAGRSSASNSADATTLAQPAQAPGPPSSITAARGNGSVTLTWGAPLTTGGSPITRYEYRYKEDTATSFGGWMSAMTELSVEVKPLKPLVLYDFEVRAVNAAGASDAVNTDNVANDLRTPLATGPTAVPQNVRAVLGTHAGTNANEGHESNAQITVSWDVVAATHNGGEVLDATTPYELCYKKSTDSDSEWMRWAGDAFSAPTSILAGARYEADHGADTSDATLLNPGTTYQYRVRAVNSIVPVGNAETCTHFDGDWSRVVSATTPVVKPSAPTLLASVTTDVPPVDVWVRNVNSLTIKWEKPASNGGAPITSYEVWVGTATGVVADDATTPDVDESLGEHLSPTVTNLPASRLEYISIGLTANTPYFYRVRATNGTGQSRMVGAWSSEQSGTTTQTEAGTPGAPAITSATPGAGGNVPVIWTAPTDQGSTPITSYEVQYQRTDDDTGATQGTELPADLDDWSDAAVGTPTPPTALTWTHMQAPGFSRFAYRVRAVNGSGAGAWSDVTGNVDVIARVADAPVLTATAVGSDEIMLQWTIPGNNGTPITGFAIQQWDPTANSNAGGWTATNLLLTGGPADDADISDEPTLTVFIVDELMAGTKYYFRIQALGGAGGTWSTADGTMAGAASATTTAGTPAMPVIMAAPGDGDDADSITVTWTAPNSGGSDITGYQIRRWDGSMWAMEGSPAAGATMYKDEDLAPGTRYYYILAAQNTNGYGPWSAAASAMTVAGNPDAPTLTAVATGADSIQLSWNVPDANGATITGYELQIWDGTAWGTTNLLGASYTETEFLSTTDGTNPLAAGTKYYYRIRALPQFAADRTTPDPAAGWSARGTSDAASATTHGDTPGRPTGFSATTVSGSTTTLTLAWTAPTDNGGSDITGYEVQIRSGGQWVTKTTLGNVATHTDTGLEAGTRYYYRVRAINSQGGGLWSAYASGTTDVGVPDAPALTATSTGMSTIRLTWNVPDDNGTSITGYVLQRWDPDATPANWAVNLGPGNDRNNLLPDDSTVTLFVDSGLASGTTYYYRIQAATAGTNGGWSTVKSATTVPGAPDRPAMVMAEADGQNAIDLTWEAAKANGSAIVRYELQVWNPATSMWDTVRNDLPSTRLSYKHSGLTAGTKYVYRVRGINRAADNGGLGKWSVIKFATTAE